MTSPRRDSPPIRGAVAGASAYVLGYLLTDLVAGSKAVSVVMTMTVQTEVGPTSLGTLLVDAEPSTWKAVGWLFYSEHLVAPSLVSPALLSFSNSVQTLEAAGVLYFLLLPPVLLGVAGMAVAGTAPSRTTRLPWLWVEIPVAARHGATVAVGYAPPALLGALLLGINLGRVGVFGPDPLLSLLVMGLTYPIVFGGAGGWLRRQLRELRTERNEDVQTDREPWE